MSDPSPGTTDAGDDEEPGSTDADPATAPAGSRPTTTDDVTGTPPDEAADLRAQLDLLAEENRRLRAEYVRARRSQYRRAAAGLGAIGLLSVGAAALFPAVRETLLVLGAIGLFGAVLTRFLTPERFVAASVGERVYGALAANESAIAAELGLSEHRVYVPTGGDQPARLFVPQREAYALPSADDLDAAFVVTDDPATRGLGLVPTGALLFREFERSTPDGVATEPRPLVNQLGDAVVEAFELADAAETDVDRDGRVATVRVSDPVLDARTRFDDPVSSLVAVGLAIGLDAPVVADTTTTESGFLVTCRWGDPPDPDREATDETAEGDGDTDASTGGSGGG